MANQDPEGKRKARERAEIAEQALALLSVASRRIASLGEPQLHDSVLNLTRDLRRLHGVEADRGGGHLEPRRKYKGRSQHLALEHNRGVISLYMDESGQSHSADQPVFVLSGVAMDEVSAVDYIKRADAMKRRYGLDPEVCLHGPQIEKGVDDFEFNGDRRKQASFRKSVRLLISRSRFQLLGAIIRNDVLGQLIGAGEQYQNLPAGLYEMALTFVAERFVDMLHADQALRPCGRLIFESIGNMEDAQHQRAFADLLVHGSEFVSGGCFRGWLRPGCEFRTKRGSHPLEIADLAARAMLTWTKQGRPNEHEFWKLWAPRIAVRGDGEKGKFGVKIFPDADIKDEVNVLRREVQSIKGEA